MRITLGPAVGLVALAVASALVGSDVGADVGPPSGPEVPLVDGLRPVVLEPDELDHVLELRDAWGLSTDAARVDALYRTPDQVAARAATDDRFAGLRISADEVSAAVRHAEVEWIGPSVRTAAIETLGDGYAGTYVDDVSVVVECAGCEPTAAWDAVVGRVPEAADALEVRVVTYSLLELVAIQTEVGNELEARLTGVTTRVDEPGNQVVVGVVASDLAAAAEVIAPHPVGAIRLEVLDAVPQDYVDKDDYYLFGVVGGGLSLDTSTQVGKCTAGVPTSNAVYGDLLLTAGHCGSTASPSWLQGGATLGGFALDNDSGSFDVAGIAIGGIRPSAGNIHSTSTDYWHPLTFAIGMNGDVTGSTVCQDGLATTGMNGNSNPSNRCGTLTSLTFDPGAGWNPVFRYATMYGSTNDSGATVYWPTVYGYGAVGVLKGGSNPGGAPVWYSHLPYALSAWGLTLKPYS